MYRNKEQGLTGYYVVFKTLLFLVMAVRTSYLTHLSTCIQQFGSVYPKQR
jgi:hypothetical protein